jgi:SAM-dependent methyltransferase
MDYSDETYGDRVAAIYDDWYGDLDPSSIDLLADLAGQGRALELGIGTGRLAIPLVARNVDVTGIDVAQAMIDQLKSKPEAHSIDVYLGSFAVLDVEGQFDLVYVVFNTFFMLTSQTEQVRCFRNVASHLTDNGSFVIEAFVPNLSRFQLGQMNLATKVTTDVIELDVGKHDSAQQLVTAQKVVLSEGNVRLYPIQIRYAWPSELDLMAQLAGLRLRERWSNWQKTPFDSESGKHISVYELER